MLNSTAGTASHSSPESEDHHFTPDSYDPGYRPCCRICGLTRQAHPYVLPSPRSPIE